jgi:biopolymer transport protein ExbD
MSRKRDLKDRDLAEGEINIISIVDVSFVLVIFCMVTMNLVLTSGINVLETKSGAATGKATMKENISIKLTQDNKIFLDDKQVEMIDLSHELVMALPKTKDKMVIITADDSNRCEQVVDILDISKKSGALRLALMNNNTDTTQNGAVSN